MAIAKEVEPEVQEAQLPVPVTAPKAVLPVMSGAEFETAYREYRELQAALDRAMPDAIMSIGGHRFRKKAYWRGLRLPFDLSCVCFRENPLTLPDGDWGYEVIYRATAGNGTYADGDGACMASEKIVYEKEWINGKTRVKKDANGEAIVDKLRTKDNATVHNVRGHAHTRAYNRAISNLVGFGEVSAEEVMKDYHPEGPSDTPPPDIGQQAAAAFEAGLEQPQPPTAVPTCPRCQAPMRERRGNKGVFWGCTKYPTCRGTRDHSATVPGATPAEQARPPAEPGITNAQRERIDELWAQLEWDAGEWDGLLSEYVPDGNLNHMSEAQATALIARLAETIAEAKA